MFNVYTMEYSASKLLHLFIIAPLLIYTGYQGIQKKTISHYIYGFFLLLGIIILLTNIIGFETFDKVLPYAWSFSTGTIDKTPRELPKPTLHLVDIIDYEFHPKFIHVLKGDTVRWMNKDTSPHVVHSHTDLFHSKPLKNGETFEHVFNTHGVYSYLCDNHPYMNGSVSVGIISNRHNGHEIMAPP